MIMNQENSNNQLIEIDEIFSEFTNDMRISFYRSYIFIPAKTKGIYVYKHKQKENKIELSKILTIAEDARDIIIQPLLGVYMLIIADYNQGIIMSRMNMTSMVISYS